MTDNNPTDFVKMRFDQEAAECIATLDGVFQDHYPHLPHSMQVACLMQAMIQRMVPQIIEMVNEGMEE